MALLYASSYEPSTKMTSAPNALVASTLEIGALSGIQIEALIPCFWAANATPCAWLPAEQAITPLLFLQLIIEQFYSKSREF